ncbi:DNRLRE domain-containing protein [Herbidospora cretacea]|uniref:DNRLRE domain-containing protein n=1 Tax=Herbidospora cretacea TaxID=28444 RepID=UPI0004C32961|nr:DNRLRE domain-containing protein [Herbidospora cretacea]
MPLLRRRALSLLAATLVATGLTAVPAAHADVTTNATLIADVGVASSHWPGSPAPPDASRHYVGDLPDGTESRAYLKFDVAPVEGRVTSATLRLAVDSATACHPGAHEGVQVSRVTTPWVPDDLHWADTPASTPDGAAVAGQDCETAPAFLEWPVTGIVRAWAGGAQNYGLAVQGPDENLDEGYWVFASAESDDLAPPVLSVTVDTGTVVVTRTVQVTPVHVQSGVTTVASLTPLLIGGRSDPLGGDLREEFEVEHDPAVPGQGVGQIWTALSDLATGGDSAVARVPEGVLQQGWLIRWRGRAHIAATGHVTAWTAWRYGEVHEVPPGVTGPAVLPSVQKGEVAVASSLTPTLRVFLTHPFGLTMRARFEVEHDPAVPEQGVGQIWAGLNAAAVPSGKPAEVALPEGALADGWRIRWRVRAEAVEAPAVSEWSGWRKVTVDAAS